jgi:hypothetical protein
VIRCIACRMSWHQADAHERYLAHKPACTTIAAAPSPQVVQQAASFLRHPAQSQRGDIAASGAPTGDGGGASSGVVSPDAAAIRPLFKWIGERNGKPLRWWL